MSAFWPNGLDLGDTASPKAILETAKAEWETESDGRLTLVLRDTQSESGNPIIVVYAKYVPENKTTSLFSVVHRPNAPYPVTIQPEKDDLPIFLKKNYKKKLSNLNTLGTIGAIAASLSNISEETYEKTITNEWVAETPSEFRSRLHDAFNLGNVKYEVLSLITDSPSNITNAENDEDDNPSVETE